MTNFFILADQTRLSLAFLSLLMSTHLSCALYMCLIDNTGLILPTSYFTEARAFGPQAVRTIITIPTGRWGQDEKGVVCSHIARGLSFTVLLPDPLSSLLCLHLFRTFPLLISPHVVFLFPECTLAQLAAVNLFSSTHI